MPTSVITTNPASSAQSITRLRRNAGNSMVPSEISTAVKPTSTAREVYTRQCCCRIAASNKVPPGQVKILRPLMSSSLRSSTAGRTNTEVPKLSFHRSM